MCVGVRLWGRAEPPRPTTVTLRLGELEAGAVSYFSDLIFHWLKWAWSGLACQCWFCIANSLAAVTKPFMHGIGIIIGFGTFRTDSESMQAVITEVDMCFLRLLLILRLAPGLGALLRCNPRQVCLNLY